MFKLTGVLLLLWFLYFIREVFPPFIVGGIIAYLLLPVVNSFSTTFKCRPGFAVAVIYVSIIGLIIGTSGLDQDLLTLLDEAVSPTLRPAIQLVGGPDGEEALQRFEHGVKAFRGRRETPPGFLFRDGFRQHTDNGQLAKFAEFDPQRNRRGRLSL